MDAALKVSRAVTKLCQTKPFWGSMMLSVGHVESEDIPTAATDGRKIYWNRGFIDELNEDEVRGLMAHEICHVMFIHCAKHGEPYDSNPRMCNIAMDYVINNTLMDDGFKLPEGGIVDTKREFVGMTWKEVYKRIHDDPEHQKMAEELTLEDVLQNSDLSEEEKMQVRQKVVAAAQAAQNKGVGKLPGGLEELIEEIRSAKVDWREFLLETFQTKFPMDYTFNRPNKKFLGSYDIYMPTMQGTSPGKILVHIDSSASVNSDELVDFLAELNEISQTFLPEEVTIVYCDTAVAHVQRFEQGEEITSLEVAGRGGTDFTPTFDWIKEEGIEVDQMLVFSDMEVWDDCFPAEHPDFDVLFLSTRKGYDVPFGTCITMGD